MSGYECFFLADDPVERDKQIDMLIWAPLKVGPRIRRHRKYDIVTAEFRELHGASLCLRTDDEIASDLDHALNTYEVQRMKATTPSTRNFCDGIIRDLKAKQRRPGKTVLVRIEAI